MKQWKSLFVLTLVLGFIASIAGCNTMEGAGEDIEASGQAIEDAAE